MRIFAGRFFEILDGGSQIGSRPFMGKECGFEIKLMCLSILRRPGGNRALLGAAKFRLQRLLDRLVTLITVLAQSLLHDGLEFDRKDIA